MNKKGKGFTLIELLAVIVILGLLMAIAIPSVTKYITQSRKKTISTTIDNYMSALTNQVNNMEYIFTASNTVYAVPIECIALERGGTSPFGEWYQANDSYWAYVLVQYDDITSAYTYGFTFKDSAGYGLYPTTSKKIDENGSQIQTNLNLNRPISGTISNITSKDNWLGFDVENNTSLLVLEAESDGYVGDGVYTCTLSQKGNNYDAVEEEKETRPQLLTKLIKTHNNLITSLPDLTTSSNNSGDASGLYVSNNTNGGSTYYFRGNVKNNNVKFAGLNWKIIRINEDGSIRMIAENRVNNTTLYFNSGYSMYYSNGSNAKTQLENWYKKNITNKGYDNYVDVGVFGEQAKVKYSNDYNGGGNQMNVFGEYTPTFKCASDYKEFGFITSKVGLITIDEVVYAGGYFGKANNNYYLTNGTFGLWTMSPAGYDSSSFALGWVAYADGSIDRFYVSYGLGLRPVINLNASVKALGTGTSSDPYVIQTN